MARRSRKKQTPPAEKNPFPGLSRKAGYWVMAVMVLVLISIVAMFGLGLYVLNQKALSDRQAAPAAPRMDVPRADVEKK